MNILLILIRRKTIKESDLYVYVVVQFYPWFKFHFLLFLGIVVYDNEFETKENKIWTKDKIEPQHLQMIVRKHDFNLTRSNERTHV